MSESLEHLDNETLERGRIKRLQIIDKAIEIFDDHIFHKLWREQQAGIEQVEQINLDKSFSAEEKRAIILNDGIMDDEWITEKDFYYNFYDELVNRIESHLVAPASKFSEMIKRVNNPYPFLILLCAAVATCIIIFGFPGLNTGYVDMTSIVDNPFPRPITDIEVKNAVFRAIFKLCILILVQLSAYALIFDRFEKEFCSRLQPADGFETILFHHLQIIDHLLLSLLSPSILTLEFPINFSNVNSEDDLITKLVVINEIMLEPYKIDDEVTGNDGQNEEMIKTYKLLQDEIVNHLYYRGYNITLGDSYDQADRCRIIEENFQEEKRRISSLLIQHIRDFDIDINREKKANWIDKINETRVGNYVQLVDKNHNGVLTILLQKDEKIYSTENMMISFKIVNGQIENLIKDFYI
jgi:hypothetical protein